MQQWISDYGVPPRLTLDDRHAEAFAALMENTHRYPNELLREAIDLLLDQHRRRPTAAKR